MFSGSLDGTLRCYNIMVRLNIFERYKQAFIGKLKKKKKLLFQTGALIKNPVQINSPIQCMDQAWGMIFIGTKSGHVSRFHIKVKYVLFALYIALH